VKRRNGYLDSLSAVREREGFLFAVSWLVLDLSLNLGKVSFAVSWLVLDLCC